MHNAPVRALVTGAAGFIGSQLVEHLLDQGDEVIGIDSLTSYYNVAQKRGNLAGLIGRRDFTFVEVDLRVAPLEQYVEGVEVVYHQAALPGVRTSWAAFPDYVDHNVLATQRLLEAARASDVARFVYASSSSVYGNAPSYPTSEDNVPQPHSPYGVTKLAGEHLVRLYGENWGLPTVSLRYFTVYGPRQRPDMAMHRLIEAALAGRQFPLYGAGEHIRDFTYVGDVVRANALAGQSDAPPGSIVNVAGGASIDMNSLIKEVETIAGQPIRVHQLRRQAGDVKITGGDISRTKDILGWQPEVSLQEGLAAQIAWHRGR